MFSRNSCSSECQNDKKANDGKLLSTCNRFSIFKGFSLAILSGICFSGPPMMVKLIQNIEPEQMGIYFFLGNIVFSIPEAVKSGENLLGPHEFRFLLVIRGLLGATNIILSYFAYRILPLGDASVIMFTVPVFVTIAARIFLKEDFGIFQSIAVLLTIAGIILTTKLPLQLYEGRTMNYTKENIIGLTCAVASVIFNTGIFIVMRKMNTVHHAILIFSSSFVSLLETVIFVFIAGGYHQHNCGISQLYIILTAFLSFLGQTLLTISMQFEQAGLISNVKASAEMILGFLFQIISFQDIPDIYSISGAILVVMSAVILGSEKYFLLLSQDSTFYKCLKWRI